MSVIKWKSLSNWKNENLCQIEKMKTIYYKKYQHWHNIIKR